MPHGASVYRLATQLRVNFLGAMMRQRWGDGRWLMHGMS
jgi:hypothetical protein